jgi:histone H3/H4
MAEAVKESAIRAYIKEKTDLRTEQEPVALLTRCLTELCDRIIERSAVLVQIEGRSTLLGRDMERAIEEIVSKGSNGKEQSPEQLYGIIKEYGIEQIGELARRIEQGLEQ